MYPVVGIVSVLAYIGVAHLLHDHPLARFLFGNAALVASALLAPAIVWRRRRHWAGCQRLFWYTLAIGLALWTIGHLGWSYDQMVLEGRSWLQWHTLFSLCGGVAPAIALFARPHRGVASEAVTTAASDLGAWGLLAVFVYAYYVLVPAVLPVNLDTAQITLLAIVQANRLLFLLGLLVAAHVARGTDWRSTYVRLATGVALGFVLRIGASIAIASDEYRLGSVYDLAWIIPWLSYAWAAAEAPSSRPEEQSLEAGPQRTVLLTAIPVLLIPAIGYGLLYVVPAGMPLDSFRALLTGVATVGGLGLLTFRLAAQKSELQRADARLRLLAAATEQTGDLILITRADGRFELANEAFLRALGYARADLAALRFSDLVEADAARSFAHIPARVARDGVWRGMLQRKRRDGSTFPASCTVVALRNAAGAVTHYVGVERDVSEDLGLRDQLVHTERLSAIGELVAGVAHEINNPLQTIVGCVELMLEDRSGSVNRRDLETVRREAARAGQIVRNLLSFVRRSAPDRSPADLNGIVRNTVELREYHLRQCNIAVETRYAPGVLPVLVNRDEIQQIVLQLLLNAEHAMTAAHGRGALSVTTATEGDGHYLEVADTGPGIRADLRGRIFEPFFTTKEVGEGTGLGLSISHGIALAHGGVLELLESLRGARFRLTLPAANVAAADEGRTDPSPERRRALVIDDERSIRGLMVRLLERRGFEVLTAESADAALTLARDGQITLILCDVRMPGISGVELYERILAHDAGLGRRFVFITGGDTSMESRQGELAHVPVLAKPFTAADLDAVLASMDLRIARPAIGRGHLHSADAANQ